MTDFVCENVGVSGTTKVHRRESSEGRVEVRMGIAIMGTSNMSEEQMEACDHNPFHEEFFDNYASGFGDTFEEAIDALKKDQQQITATLWS